MIRLWSNERVVKPHTVTGIINKTYLRNWTSRISIYLFFSFVVTISRNVYIYSRLYTDVIFSFQSKNLMDENTGKQQLLSTILVLRSMITTLDTFPIGIGLNIIPVQVKGWRKAKEYLQTQSRGKLHKKRNESFQTNACLKGYCVRKRCKNISSLVLYPW